MNKTYRSIWNETTGTWVAVQEDAAARGKRSSKAVIAGASGIVGVLNVIGVMGGAALATSAHADTVADNSAARVVAVGTDSVASLDNAAVVYGTGSYADSGLGLLPGVAVGSQADGMQGAFAVNLGQVAPVVGAAPVASGSGGVQMLAMNSAPLLGASLASSGIDTGDLNTSFKTAAWYTQIKGIANAAGSAAPTDAARVVGLGSIAMGSNTQSDGNGSMALGTQSYAKANDSVALGTGSVSTQANTVSVGSDGTATHVVYNADGVATTLQSTANTRRIVNMAAGQGDTDAVNVAQLKGITDSLGGGATVNGDGSITPPSYTAGGTTFHNVGDTLTNIDQRTTQNTTNITQLQGLMADAVSYDGPSHDAVSLGTPGKPVALHNVAPGALSESSTDAVNGSQLFSTNTNLSNLAGTVTNIAGDVTNMAGQVADAVKYDSPQHTSVTLGNPGTPVKLQNLAAGLATTDAVNVGQLASAGFSVDASSGAVQNQAVTYNAGSTASGSPTITLAPGEGSSPYFRNGDRADGHLPKGTVISNVASGIQDTDAANVGQLWDIVNGSAAGALAPQTMMAKSANVNLLASSNGSGIDTSGLNTSFKTAAWYTQIKGIANAVGSAAPTDAARVIGLGSIAMGSNTQSDGNASMALGSFDAVNGAQLYGLAASTASALGGQVAVNPNGTITAPSYQIGNSSYSNVGSALDAVADLARGGSADAVIYDSGAHDKVTLGGKNASAPVKLTNVANATQSGDAVNLAQLQAMGGEVDTSGNVTNAFVAYDDTTKRAVTLGGKGSSAAVVNYRCRQGGKCGAVRQRRARQGHARRHRRLCGREADESRRRRHLVGLEHRRGHGWPVVCHERERRGTDPGSPEHRRYEFAVCCGQFDERSGFGVGQQLDCHGRRCERIGRELDGDRRQGVGHGRELGRAGCEFGGGSGEHGVRRFGGQRAPHHERRRWRSGHGRCEHAPVPVGHDGDAAQRLRRYRGGHGADDDSGRRPGQDHCGGHRYRQLQGLPGHGARRVGAHYAERQGQDGRGLQRGRRHHVGRRYVLPVVSA